MPSGPPAIAEGDDRTHSLKETSLAIRQQFADQLEAYLRDTKPPNPLWATAEAGERCDIVLRKAGCPPMQDRTFGDLDWRRFEGERGRAVAEQLGLVPDGPKNLAIEATMHQILVDHTEPATSSRWGYQREAIGDPILRKYFVDHLQSFGIPVTTEQTILAMGSFQGIDHLLGAFRREAERRRVGCDFIMAVPGFYNIALEAKERSIPVKTVPGEEQCGYCATPDSVAQVLGRRNSDMTIFYETPMANPTSSVYDPEVLAQTNEVFLKLRPNGIIIPDLAYDEMIPKEQALDVLKTYLSEEVLQSSIWSNSMSKLFGYPGLRMASLSTTNEKLFRILQNHWKVAVVTLSDPTERAARARWLHVSAEDRLAAFNLLRARQVATLQHLMRVNQELQGLGYSPIIDMSHVHREIPLYLWLKLGYGYTFLDLFRHAGILGAPGTMFGGRKKDNMIRLSMGIAPILDDTGEWAIT